LRTRSFAAGPRVKAFDGFARKLSMKLDQRDAAISLLDLDLPGNRLEAPKGDRKG
jgi:plasmid maintenance system killer protein